MMPFWVLTGIAKTLQDLLVREIPSNAWQLGKCEFGATSCVNGNPCVVNRVLVRFSFFGTRARIQFCETTVGTRFGAISRMVCRILFIKARAFPFTLHRLDMDRISRNTFLVYTIRSNIVSGEHFSKEFANDLVARTLTNATLRELVSSHLSSSVKLDVVTHDHVV